MRRALLFLTLAVCILGCSTTATTPPVALAPGYSSQADQTLGQSLAAIDAFVTQEKANYAQLTPALQAAEKPYLNNLIAAANAANHIYLEFHQGVGGTTLAQAQAAFATAQSAQTALAANKGVGVK